MSMFGFALGAGITWAAALYIEREIFHSARDTAARLNGTMIVSKVQPQILEEEVAFAKHMGLHALAALASTWNQSVDAVFQPVISELQKRGW